MKYCDKCGTQIKDSSAFCTKCGNKVCEGSNSENIIKRIENRGLYSLCIVGFFIPLVFDILSTYCAYFRPMTGFLSIVFIRAEYGNIYMDGLIVLIGWLIGLIMTSILFFKCKKSNYHLGLLLCVTGWTYSVTRLVSTIFYFVFKITK